LDGYELLKPNLGQIRDRKKTTVEKDNVKNTIVRGDNKLYRKTFFKFSKTFFLWKT